MSRGGEGGNRYLAAALAAVLVAALAGCGPKTAAPKTTECQDGTHSTSTGRGTCSGHGGIKDGNH